MNCIIVDDEPLGRKAIQLLAKETPVLNVLGVFGDADSAGKFILENQVDVIFLDIRMPGIDGIEFAKSIPKKTTKTEEVKAAQGWMCENYYDVRTFGAVMSTGDYPCGVVRGPVQINFAKSIEPVVPQEITITRQAVTNAKDAGKETEMGKKAYIPYGLYKAEGFISAALANKTGFTDDDLELLWNAIINMFEHDRSAARGKMMVRKLIVFKHESVLGNAQSHTLLERVTITRKESYAPARAYSDYEVSVDCEYLPEGVSIIEKL